MMEGSAFYSWMLLLMNVLVGFSVLEGGMLGVSKPCSRPLSAYLIVSGLLWMITGIQDFKARKAGWFKTIECPNPNQVMQAQIMAAGGIFWLLVGNLCVLTTTTCSETLFWLTRYYCIAANVCGIVLLSLLTCDATAMYAESLLGVNYSIVWRRKFARDAGFSDLDAADAEYIAYGR